MSTSGPCTYMYPHSTHCAHMKIEKEKNINDVMSCARPSVYFSFNEAFQVRDASSKVSAAPCHMTSRSNIRYSLAPLP